MLTLDAAFARTAVRLAEAGVESPDVEAAWLVETATGAGRTERLVRGDRPVLPESAAVLDLLLARRLGGEPVQYVTGKAAFRYLSLAVGPGVLVPRPETEELAGLALAALDGLDAPRVLDLCTGSGCLALALVHEHPGATAHAVDVSDEALAWAARNVAATGLPVALHRADVLAPALPAAVAEAAPFDVLVANPPYVPATDVPTLDASVRDFEPRLALVPSGPDPLVFYPALARHGEALVRPGGAVAVEIEPDLAPGVVAAFARHAYASAEVHRDLYGRNRFVLARRLG